MKEKLRNIRPVYIVAVLLLAAVLAIVIAFAVFRAKAAPYEVPVTAAAAAPEPEIVYVEKEVEKIVEVEKEISAEMISDGLKDMGFLVTQEYYFTEVITNSSVKNLKIDWMKIDAKLPGTSSSYAVQYDGTVTAGLNMAEVSIKKDERSKTIIVDMPEPEMMNTSIDFDSFKLIYENQGVFNPLTVEDYNESLSQLVANAEQKAIERGLPDSAAANGRVVIENFIRSVAGPGWNVVFE